MHLRARGLTQTVSSLSDGRHYLLWITQAHRHICTHTNTSLEGGVGAGERRSGGSVPLQVQGQALTDGTSSYLYAQALAPHPLR